MSFINNIVALPLKMIVDFIGNYGISIIIFTVFVRLALLPLAISQKKSMVTQQKLQPQVSEIQRKHKSDPQTAQRKQMELYKEHNYNPMSGCLPLIIQLPIIIALFNVLRSPEKYNIPTEIVEKSFLWMKSLKLPDMLSNLLPGLPLAESIPGILPIIAAAAIFVSSRFSMKQTALQPRDPNGPKMPNMNFMIYLGPVLTLLYAKIYPGGLALYMAVSYFIQIFQDRYLNHVYGHKEDVV